MWEIDTEKIRKISGFTPVEQDELFRWFAMLPISLRVVTLRLQGELSRSWRKSSQQGRKVESDYACLLMAAWRLRCLEEGRCRRSVPGGPALVRKIQVARVRDRRPKPSPRKELILGKYRELIFDLRRNGMSWRQIASYLRKYHRQTFSHGYLRQTVLALHPDPRHQGAPAGNSGAADSRLPPD